MHTFETTVRLEATALNVLCCFYADFHTSAALQFRKTIHREVFSKQMLTSCSEFMGFSHSVPAISSGLQQSF